jgi:hypothetical protein
MVLAQHLPKCWWGLPKAQQSLTPSVDWLDGLIGPGGLLWVVSHLLPVAVSALWVKLGINK